MKDQDIINIFKTYDQLEKIVYLKSSVLTVWNIAWGYDIGDDFAHITTNISPEIKDSDIDYFYTNEIEKIEDRSNGKILYDRKKSYNIKLEVPFRGFRGTAIITGANGGIGQQLSQAAAIAGYSVVMACKNKTESECICTQIKEKTNCSSIEVMELDLASFTSIQRFVNEFQSKYGKLDLLLNNAGVLCHTPQETEEHVEYTIGVNYLGHYLLTELLHPMMNNGTKIINTVSLMLRYGKINTDLFSFSPTHFNRFPYYSDSKLALYYAALDWSERWANEGITVNCVDPGIVSTNIIRMGNKLIDKLCDIFYRPLIRTPRQGADTIIYLFSENKTEPITGEVFKSRKIKAIPKHLQENKQRAFLKEQTLKFLSQHEISF